MWFDQMVLCFDDLVSMFAVPGFGLLCICWVFDSFGLTYLSVDCV